MSQESLKPDNLERLWPEKELCAQLNLPLNPKTGRSTVLSNWIRGGLRCAEKSRRRYYFEQDVIDYLWSRREKED